MGSKPHFLFFFHFLHAPAGACGVVIVDRDGLPLAQKGHDHFG
jgi:predicted regulator of Ras-like GTPase activity (Roadblock/LC7/MglB family)